MPSFVDDIAAISSPLGPSPDTSFYVVWEQFLAGLTQAGYGAAIRGTVGGLQYLILWPRFRPDWFSVALTFKVESTHSLIVDGHALQTEAELREWLLGHARSYEFQALLHFLREQESRPVTAKLEVEGADPITAEVSASDQETLHGVTNSTSIVVHLHAGDSSPKPERLRRLSSAGLHFSVLCASVHGSRITLNLEKDLR